MLDTRHGSRLTISQVRSAHLVDDGSVPGFPTEVDGHLAAQRKRAATKASKARPPSKTASKPSKLQGLLVEDQRPRPVVHRDPSVVRLPRCRRHPRRCPDVLRALPGDQDPRRQRRLQDRDDQGLLLRRQARDRHVRDPGPREHPAVRHAGLDAGCCDRRRGPHVLHQPRHRLQGHHPRGAQQRDER